MRKARGRTFEEVEKLHGAPMADILTDLYREYGDKESPQVTIAEKLGVKQSTISAWVGRAGLKPKTILVKSR